MKFLVLILSLSFSSTIFAKEIRCLSASGYYGNVSVFIDSEKVEVEAAQGFSSLIPGAHHIKVTFLASECITKGAKISCASTEAKIHASFWSNEDRSFQSFSSFEISTVSDVHKEFDMATLTIDGESRTRFFGESFPQERCVLR